MSQALKRTTTNRLHFASTGAVRQRQAQPATLTLSIDQMETLWELCALAAYHQSGFTYTDEMEAVTKFIADKSSPAAIAACLARADIRERAAVRR
jgi:hypothetical protein